MYIFFIIAHIFQDRVGLVVYAGISPEQLDDPFHPPAGATGPYTISGNNR
jgi:hypothetical protein